MHSLFLKMIFEPDAHLLLIQTPNKQKNVQLNYYVIMYILLNRQHLWWEKYEQRKAGTNFDLQSIQYILSEKAWY